MALLPLTIVRCESVPFMHHASAWRREGACGSTPVHVYATEHSTTVHFDNTRIHKSVKSHCVHWLPIRLAQLDWTAVSCKGFARSGLPKRQATSHSYVYIIRAVVGLARRYVFFLFSDDVLRTIVDFPNDARQLHCRHADIMDFLVSPRGRLA